MKNQIDKQHIQTNTENIETGRKGFELNKKNIETNRKNVFGLLHPSIRQDLFHPTRLLYMGLFALIFMFIGVGVPDIYFKYIDKTEYIKVVQPVHVEQEIYKRGEDISVTIIRTSLINTQGHIVIQLHLVRDNNTESKYILANSEIAIVKSDNEIFYQTYTLPIDIPVGNYHLEAVVNYPYRNLIKTYAWKSESFSIEDVTQE